MPQDQRAAYGVVPSAPDPLPIPVVDNHCHLNIVRGDGPTLDIEESLRRAAQVGVPKMVQNGCDVESARWTVEAVEKYPQLLGSVAIHPNDAARHAETGDLDEALAVIEELTLHPRIRCVGETGLDYFRTAEEGRAAQHEAFRWHIDLAKRRGLPLQIHDRDAHDDVLRILDEEGAPEHTVLHCFSGDIGFARACLDRGFHLSFAGTVTFKSSKGLRDALAIAPLDRLLVETDAPYLTPMPWRGSVNAPYLVPLTVRSMAATRNVSVPELCTALAANSERLYGPW